MIKAVLFDNDGVLVDTETLFFQTTRRAFTKLGLKLDQETWAQRYLTDAKSSKDIAISMGADTTRVAEIIDDRNREYWQVLQKAPPLRPHVLTTLKALEGKVKLAIVTGCGREQLDLVHMEGQLLSRFDLIVTSDDCNDGKPHPEPYLKAVRALALQPEQCMAVEDSPRGLASARAAGVPCIVVPTELTSMLEFPGALAVEQDISGILKHISPAPTPDRAGV